MSEALISRSDRWLEWLHKKYPKREYKTSVVDINGKLVFITSYFKKLAPPTELLQSGTDQEKAVRNPTNSSCYNFSHHTFIIYQCAMMLVNSVVCGADSYTFNVLYFRSVLLVTSR